MLPPETQTLAVVVLWQVFWTLASTYSTLSCGLSLSPSSASLSPPICYRINIFFVLKIHVEILSPNRMILGSFLREKIGHQHQTQLNTITTIVKTHVWLRSFCLCPARWEYNVKSHLWIRNWPLLEPDMLVLWPQPSRLKTSEKWVLLFICLLKNFLNLIF